MKNEDSEMQCNEETKMKLRDAEESRTMRLPEKDLTEDSTVFRSGRVIASKLSRNDGAGGVIHVHVRQGSPCTLKLSEA